MQAKTIIWLCYGNTKTFNTGSECLKGLGFSLKCSLYRMGYRIMLLALMQGSKMNQNFPEAVCLFGYQIMGLALLLPSCMPQFPCR